MSNLGSAAEALKAELTHAREGLAFYQARIEALEKTLLQLAGIDGGAPNVGTGRGKSSVKVTKGAVGRRAKSTNSNKPPKFSKTKKSSAGKKLPFTGGDFWVGLITSQPQSVSDILKAAVSKLGISPSTSEIKKLAGRQTFALNAMVKSKQIQDSGKGRERRFFKG
jgi:hypothetical protein